MMDSIWLEHPDHPGYRFSSEGRMLSLSGAAPLVCDFKPTKSGYVLVTLSKNKTKRRILLHRIIAQIFCDGFEPGKQVNHKNGIRSDNRWENLEWVTSKENHAHAKHVLKRSFARGEQSSYLSETTVKEIYRLRFNERLKLNEIAEYFKTTRATVASICTGKTWKHLFKAEGIKKTRISASLSEEDIQEIRRIADPKKRNYGEVAAQFNTSRSMVCLIYNRKTWASLK